MKVLNKQLIGLFLLGIILSISFISFAQKTKGNGNIITQERSLPEFNTIEVGGAYMVFLSQGDEQSVKVETDENIQSQVITKVDNNILKISSKSIRRPTKLNIYIAFKDINCIKASGASTIRGENKINTAQLKIKASGASNVNLDISVNTLQTEISGAADVKLKGTANSHTSKISGAGRLKAFNLLTQKTKADISGAGDAKINAKQEVVCNISGAGNVSLKQEPSVKIIKNKRRSHNVKLSNNNIFLKANKEKDSTEVDIGSLKIKVIDNDTTKIKLGNNTLSIDENGNVKFKRHKKNKFNGHWGGVDMGVNGYLYNGYYNIPNNNKYNFLNLKYEKSVCVNINAYEQNFNLYKNHFGLITGLGLQYNNYRFDDNIVLKSDTSIIWGFSGNDENPTRKYKKSKLSVTYLTVPLLLEYQTNRNFRNNSFHITGGIVLGTRLSSHSKQVYKDDGKRKDKNRDDFHIQPFRYDLTARIGWGIINLFGTYSLNTLFNNNEGPEINPFSIGITLCNW